MATFNSKFGRSDVFQFFYFVLLFNRLQNFLFGFLSVRRQTQNYVWRFVGPYSAPSPPWVGKFFLAMGLGQHLPRRNFIFFFFLLFFISLNIYLVRIIRVCPVFYS